MSLLLVLKGKEILEIDTANGYLSIIFDNRSSGLHIFNNYTTDMENIHDIVGKVIKAVEMADDHWRMIFEDGTHLRIGMLGSDYNGPESFIYFAGSNVYVEQ